MIVPKFGVGTFRLKGHAVIDSVRTALEVGYRAIDTAQIYANEAEVGQAIKESGVPRQDLFITTKIWTDHYAPEKLIPSLKGSLQKLKMESVNLTLIHWPAPAQGFVIAEIMESLLEAKQQGLTEHIGVSNFNINQVQQAIDAIGVEHVATNQIELSPYLQNHKLVNFLQQCQIDVTSYMTLAYGKVINDPILQQIAQHLHATSAQVALAWALQRGFAVIPSSTKRENLIRNLQAQDLQLTEHDMQQIATLERNQREVNPEQLAPIWD